MNKSIVILMIAVFLLGISAGHVSYKYLFEPSKPEQIQEPQEILKKEQPPLAGTSATIFVPAIDNEGNGVALPLNVKSSSGPGEILIDINNLVFWFDTQQSIQTARSVAQNITGVDTSKINLVYMIETNATLVGGPSAGAALTIATISALENKTLNKSVMVTGTINPDGTIGKIGGILEKAKAAKQAGAKLFLVPSEQGTETFLKPEEKCIERARFVYCETRYRQVIIDISETAGIQVIEVSTISEAEKYFFD